MKRILHIITDLPVGGAETMLLRLLTRMDRQSFESAVVCLGEGGPMAESISRLNIPVFATHRSIRQLHRTASRFQPDVIQGWMYHGNIASLLERFRLPGRIPVVWNIRHSLYDLKKEKRATAWLIRLGGWMSSRPEQIIYNSRTAEAQHEKFGYDPGRALVIPNGFDCEEFKPDPDAKHSVCSELGFEKDTIVIGLFARYHPMKDHDTFLKAASLLLRSGVRAHFVLVGSGAGPANAALSKQIAGLEISQWVRCLGPRQDMPRLNAALDIAVSSSCYGEGFPNVIGEAMACGVPCVATNVGDSGDLIGDAGKVVPVGDPEALASAWRDLIEQEKVRRRLGTHARDRIIEHFSLGRIVALYQNLYLKILESHGS